MARIYNSMRMGGDAALPEDMNPMLSPAARAARKKPRTTIKDPRLVALDEGTPVYTVK